MGGKTWSREEELYFWRIIVPTCPKAAAPLGKAVDWEQSALMMRRHFGKRARRNYTKLMLFEHYFQNITTGHESPRAADLVAEHKRHLSSCSSNDSNRLDGTDKVTIEDNGKDVNGIVAAHNTRTRRAAKRIESPEPANKSPESPPSQVHARANGPAIHDPQTLDSIEGGSRGVFETHGPLTYQMPASTSGYYGGHFYHGLPFAPRALTASWFSNDDSGYMSATSPSSHESPSSLLVDMAVDGGDGAAANAMGRVE